VGGQVEGHLGYRPVATVEQQRMTDPAAQGRSLVHPTGRGLGNGVLGIDTDVGERCAGIVIAGQTQVQEVGHRHGDGALESRGAGEPGAQRHLAVKHEVKSDDGVAASCRAQRTPAA